MIQRLPTLATLILVLAASTAGAGEETVIEGVYVQTQPCRGDGTDPKELVVKITPQQITHASGVCSIDEKHQDGKSIAMRTTCKFESGAVMVGDITFTVRDEKTLDMTDRDKIFSTVLYKCSAGGTVNPNSR